jgi:hypothetical protein
MVGPTVATSSASAGRGSERLLWDCDTVGRSIENDQATAQTRLETELGEHMAQLLLATLREAEPSTAHEERLWRAARDSAA